MIRSFLSNNRVMTPISINSFMEEALLKGAKLTFL